MCRYTGNCVKQYICILFLFSNIMIVHGSEPRRQPDVEMGLPRAVAWDVEADSFVSATGRGSASREGMPRTMRMRRGGDQEVVICGCTEREQDMAASACCLACSAYWAAQGCCVLTTACGMFGALFCFENKRRHNRRRSHE